jgi:hypothetical protein
MSESNQVEVAPGCWMTKKYLATEEGQSFAEHIRKDYERRQAMSYERVPPEVWRFEVDIDKVGPARIELDAQKLISEVTRMTAPLTGYPSGWTADKERDHAVPIIKAVRQILRSRIRRDLRAAFNILKADAMFDASPGWPFMKSYGRGPRRPGWRGSRPTTCVARSSPTY